MCGGILGGFFVHVLTFPSRSHRAKCVPCGPDLRGVRLVGGAYPFPNLPPLLSHRELCPGTAPAHLPAPPQRLPAWPGMESKCFDFTSWACNCFPLCLYLLLLPATNIAFELGYNDSIFVSFSLCFMLFNLVMSLFLFLCLLWVERIFLFKLFVKLCGAVSRE